MLDKGELNAALSLAHSLKDSINRNCDNSTVKALAAIKLTDVQNWHTLFNGRAFDTARALADGLQSLPVKADSITPGN